MAMFKTVLPSWSAYSNVTSSKQASANGVKAVSRVDAAVGTIEGTLGFKANMDSMGSATRSLRHIGIA